MKNKNDNTFKAERVTLCQDGKYRWVYDVNLFTNPTVFFDVEKVMLLSLVIMVAIVLLMGLITGNLEWDLVKSMGVGFAWGSLFITGLTLVGYIVYALIVGGKYTVLFTLDEKELVHQEYGKTLEKAKLIGELTMLAGAAGGRVGTIGTGMLAASRTTMTTELKHVRRVIPRRWMNTIKVNQLLSKNRVYVKKQDFDFVYQFLCEHCVNAKNETTK